MGKSKWLVKYEGGSEEIEFVEKTNGVGKVIAITRIPDPPLIGKLERYGLVSDDYWGGEMIAPVEKGGYVLFSEYMEAVKMVLEFMDAEDRIAPDRDDNETILLLDNFMATVRNYFKLKGVEDGK